MPIKNNYDNLASSDSFEVRDYHGKSILNKYEHDLYDEEKNLVEKVVRIKRVKNKGEKWHVSINNKLVFTLEASKISKKEREYLRTADGFNFLIAQFKTEVKSVNRLKIELKNHLK
jgi:hypothetical protein